MNKKEYDELINKLTKKVTEANNKKSSRLDLDLAKRIIERLNSFECEECQKHLDKINEYISYLYKNKLAIDKAEDKQYRRVIGNAKLHLLNKHGLVTPNYYLCIYLSIGMSMGIVFGTVMGNNMLYGIPIGIIVGLAIGYALDADKKKKGKVL